MAGYNGNFESWVSDGVTYDTFYIKFNDLSKSDYNWGDYIKEDSMVIIAVPNASTPGNSGISGVFENALESALGSVVDDSAACITTTTTTTA